ncbi:uncharacterized protein An07g07200 [Aspergillus niger]|uniref:Contig An07c0210, genomic contig n=2 Tax=Aspergillus niger TaxID=5061 RepID=A2QNW0_ASPNC|nr:uncharacterized protein An07g07200 [Aspergillus niger]CAL00762.1 unnamed protein product [Aspergillus niger]
MTWKQRGLGKRPPACRDLNALNETNKTCSESVSPWSTVKVEGGTIQLRRRRSTRGERNKGGQWPADEADVAVAGGRRYWGETRERRIRSSGERDAVVGKEREGKNW